MTKTIHIDKKDVPEMILRAFPGYRGRKFEIRVAEEVHMYGCAWEGGSKNDYVAVDLDTGRSYHNTVEFGNMFVRAPGSATVPLPPNAAVVCHKIFCGKDLGLTIYLHPSRVAKLLPERPELTRDQEIVLAATCGLKSFARFYEANYHTGITQERYDAAKSELIGLGYLSKRGAATTAGRNARPDKDLRQLGQEG